MNVDDAFEYLRKNGGFLARYILDGWGISLADPGLLWVTNRGAPSFQFENRAIIPIVARINKHLGAQTRPWLAALWWVDNHGHERPVILLKQGKFDELTRLALL